MIKKRIHTVIGILIGISAVLAGICLIAACVGIYCTGDRPFSPAAVAQAFSEIQIPVYICLALILFGWIFDGICPADAPKRFAEKQHTAILEKLHQKLDPDRCPDDIQDKIQKQQNARRLLQTLSILILLICSIIFLCYGANSRNFDQMDITGSMIRAMAWFVPCLAVPFAFAVFAACFRKKSILAETALVKDALANGGTAQVPAVSVSRKATGLPWLRWALLAVAVGILVYGYFAGGTLDVLTKAVNICTECVGLG